MRKREFLQGGSTLYCVYNQNEYTPDWMAWLQMCALLLIWSREVKVHRESRVPGQFMVGPPFLAYRLFSFDFDLSALLFKVWVKTRRILVSVSSPCPLWLWFHPYELTNLITTQRIPTQNNITLGIQASTNEFAQAWLSPWHLCSKRKKVKCFWN